jgi:hypothetical protein
MRPEIQKAYELIGAPIDPNLAVPAEVMDIVDFKASEPGEAVEYFASDATVTDDIYAAESDGTITYHKISLSGVTALTFAGLQSKMETVLLEEIMNSHDQTALARKKESIIRAMDKEEARRVLALVLAVASQEITPDSDDDILDVIIKMQQLVSDYADNYILLVASDVQNKIDTYDKDRVTTDNYKIDIMASIAKLGIKKVVKVIGTLTNSTGAGQKVLANGHMILVGRNSSLAEGNPLKMRRRKFNKEIAERSGAKEGDTRLVNFADTPMPINADNANTLGYSVFGYESVISVLVNYRAVAWADVSSLL